VTAPRCEDEGAVGDIQTSHGSSCHESWRPVGWEQHRQEEQPSRSEVVKGRCSSAGKEEQWETSVKELELEHAESRLG
jgi:hypothetical protein